MRCVLLRERAEAKRRGELELMRNEQDDGVKQRLIEVDTRGRQADHGCRSLRDSGHCAAFARYRTTEKLNSTTWNYSVLGSISVSVDCATSLVLLPVFPSLIIDVIPLTGQTGGRNTAGEIVHLG